MKGKPLCLYHDDDYKEEDADFEPCMPLRREVSRRMCENTPH